MIFLLQTANTVLRPMIHYWNCGVGELVILTMKLKFAKEVCFTHDPFSSKNRRIDWVINIFYHLSSLLKLHQIIFIENQDEYTKIESFSCSYTHWNYFETIDEAKLFCSTDKSCFGITILKQSKHEDRFRPCTFPTRISSDESYDLFVKESNTGKLKVH